MVKFILLLLTTICTVLVAFQFAIDVLPTMLLLFIGVVCGYVSSEIDNAGKE